MRINLFLIVVILVTIMSCHDDSDNCKYDLNMYPTDTSLFVSFEVNGNYHKYYQGMLSSGQDYLPIDINETMSLRYFNGRIGFGKLYSDTVDIYFFPSFSFKFWDYSIYDPTVPRFFGFSKLSEMLETENEYLYTYPPEGATINDTIFMRGVSFPYGLGDATQNVMEYFDYNSDSISEFYSDDAFFNISSIESVCNGNFLVKGTFLFKTIDSKEPENIIYYRNGKFTFLME